MVIILCLYLVGLWVVFSKFKLVRWGWLSGTYPRDVCCAFQLSNAVGTRDGDRPRGRSDAECDGTNCRNPSQAERAGEKGRRAVSDRSGAVSVQGLAVAGVARGGEAADRNPKIELRAGDCECRGPRRQLTTKSVSPTFRRWPPRRPTRNFRRRTSRFSTRPCRRSSSRPKRRNRVPSLRWIPKSAASTRRLRKLRRNSRTRVGNCRRHPFALRPTAMSRSSL